MSSISHSYLPALVLPVLHVSQELEAGIPCSLFWSNTDSVRNVEFCGLVDLLIQQAKVLGVGGV